jgi:hypothetical protein
MYKSMKTRYARLVGVGQRGTTLIGEATTATGALVYSDEDGDGFLETATITLATTLTDEREIRLYYHDTDAHPDWEIRPLNSVEITGGFVQITLNSWLLIDPELYEEYPNSNGLGAIDVSTAANFVVSVDVYREYIDTTLPQAVLEWEATSGDCIDDDCDPVLQDACVSVRNYELGQVVPKPATYSGGIWSLAAFANYYEPDLIKLYYYAGDTSKEYKRGLSLKPLSLFWEQCIAWIATARIERPLCGCGNAKNLADDLRKDLSINTREASHFYMTDVTTNPFGTKKGEVMAWRRIKYMVKKKVPAEPVMV